MVAKLVANNVNMIFKFRSCPWWCVM